MNNPLYLMENHLLSLNSGRSINMDLPFIGITGNKTGSTRQSRPGGCLQKQIRCFWGSSGCHRSQPNRDTPITSIHSSSRLILSRTYHRRTHSFWGHPNSRANPCCHDFSHWGSPQCCLGFLLELAKTKEIRPPDGLS